MAHGGRRTGAGRPKGSKDRHPRPSRPVRLAKEAAREVAREWITSRLVPLLEAAYARATGMRYLVTRDAKTGKFVRITASTLGATETAIEVWEKEPDAQAIRDLLDRALDKAQEPPLDITVRQAVDLSSLSDVELAQLERLLQRGQQTVQLTRGGQ